MSNALQLLYEGQHRPIVRPSLINAIKESARNENWAAVEELAKAINAHEYQELLGEGIWDRMKASGAGAVGAVKGVADRVGGAINTAKGNIANAAGNFVANNIQSDPSQGNKLTQYGQQQISQGQQQTQQGQQAGMNSKIQSYVTNASNTIVNDFQKLGLPLADSTAFKQALIQTFYNAMKPVQQTPQPVSKPVIRRQQPTKPAQAAANSNRPITMGPPGNFQWA
jgi:hypothetical protein